MAEAEQEARDTIAAVGRKVQEHADGSETWTVIGPELADAILQALAEAGYELVRWQPIETAPKDGEPFWGRVGYDAIRMLWHSEFEEFVSSWRRVVMAKGYTIDGKTYSEHSPEVHHPDAWMPMPDYRVLPPSQQGAAQPVPVTTQAGADSDSEATE